MRKIFLLSIWPRCAAGSASGGPGTAGSDSGTRVVAGQRAQSAQSVLCAVKGRSGWMRGGFGLFLLPPLWTLTLTQHDSRWGETRMHGG